VRMGGRVPASIRDAVMNVTALRRLCAGLLFGRPSAMTARAMLDDLAAMAGAAAFDAVVATGRGYMFAATAPTVPVTVAWGTRDRILWPRQARTAARELPGARHVVLPGCGHLPMYDDPALVARTIVDTCHSASRVRTAGRPDAVNAPRVTD